MASSINKYAQNIARARYQTQGGTQSVPVTGRNGPKIDPSLFSGKTAPKGGAGGLESRQIPAAIQEAGPEAMSVEGGEASMQPQMVTETQQPIENRGGSARYMIQGGGPKIDLSFLVPERANKSFDPSKAIGGENLPFQESKGVGGFFRRMLGDESNQQNIAAQQAQGAEWKAEAAATKERQGKIDDYRTQKNIDAEIDNAREDKRNTQAVTMFDKAQEAQRAVLSLQNDYAKARNADEQADILKRMGVAHSNAMTLQDKALAATASNQGLQQTFQAKLANFNAQMKGFENANNITNLGDGFFAIGGDVRATTKGSPGYPGTPATDPTVSSPLLGPAGKGRQLPQMDVGGADPAMAPVTPTRSNVPSLQLTDYTQLAPGDGVRMGGKLPAPVPTPAPAPAPQPTDAAVTPPRSAMTGEQGEETRGLFPSIGDYLGEAGKLNLADEAPITGIGRNRFMAGLSDVGRGISENVRAIEPLLMGGRLPEVTPKKGGGALGMLLNAPLAAATPVEAALTSMVKTPMRAMRGVDPTASMAVPSRATDANTVYMGDQEYKNYLRNKRLNK